MAYRAAGGERRCGDIMHELLARATRAGAFFVGIAVVLVAIACSSNENRVTDDELDRYMLASCQAMLELRTVLFTPVYRGDEDEGVERVQLAWHEYRDALRAIDPPRELARYHDDLARFADSLVEAVESGRLDAARPIVPEPPTPDLPDDLKARLDAASERMVESGRCVWAATDVALVTEKTRSDTPDQDRPAGVWSLITERLCVTRSAGIAPETLCHEVAVPSCVAADGESHVFASAESAQEALALGRGDPGNRLEAELRVWSFFTQQGAEVEACWDLVKIGDPLPLCWETPLLPPAP